MGEGGWRREECYFLRQPLLAMSRHARLMMIERHALAYADMSNTLC